MGAPSPAVAQTAVTDPAPFLTTNIYNGPRSKRLNILVFGDGFLASQTTAFQTNVTNVINFLMSTDPYKEYKSYFNVFSVFTASLEEGADHLTPSNVTVDTYFNCTFDANGTQRLLVIPSSPSTYMTRLSNLKAQFLPEFSIVIMLVNDTQYGGSGGSTAVTSLNPMSPYIAQHEIGHSFGALADEYDSYYAYPTNEYPNCTADTNRNTVRWSPWIEASTPILTPETLTYDDLVGVFEGCNYQPTGWYRPHNNSFMKSIPSRPVGQVNNEQLIHKIYKASPDYISPLEAFYPTSTAFTVSGVTNLYFSVTPMKPETHTLQTAWYLDGTNLTGETGTNLLLSSFAIGHGTHTVSNSTWDATTNVLVHTNKWFLTDPLIGGVSWNLSISNQGATITTLADAHGSIVPSGPILIPFGGKTSFVATADSFYHLDMIHTNGTAMTLTNSVSMGITLTNVLFDSTVSVSFAENLSAMETPEWWLNSYYPGTNNFTNAAMTDTDGDGLPNWAEYKAGTDPTSVTSCFQVLHMGLTGGNNELRWYATTNSQVFTDFTVEMRTNLFAGLWSLVASNLARQSSGTNVWVHTNPPTTGPVFYRISIP